MKEGGSEDVEVIAEKTPVCLVSDPTKTGVVMSVSGERDLAQYSVFLDDTERYEAKVARIRETAARADIVFRKIANGVIIVEG